MSRLIDADKLEPDTEWNDYDDDFVSYSQSQIKDAEEVKAVPLDKVKQAREEIDDLSRYFDNDYCSDNRNSMFKCNEVLEILKRNIGKSEE